MIEILERCWLARIAKYSSEKIELSTPEVLHIDVKGAPAPERGAKMVRSSVKEGERGGNQHSLCLLPSKFFSEADSTPLSIDPGYRGAEGHDEDARGEFPALFLRRGLGVAGDIVPIGDLGIMTGDPRKFASQTVRLRRELGPDKLLYAPGLADPTNLSVLCYIGIDLVDTFGTVMRSVQGQVIVNGQVLNGDSPELRDIPELGECPGFEAVYGHNLRQLDYELRVVKNAIREGTLRQLVELRARQSSWMIQAIRLCDLENFDEIEQWTPVTGRGFLASSKESLWRPDIERYRRRMRERYVPPAHAQVLLLLPCSAKKPYSSSRSHRRFSEVIRGSGLASAIHEVVVTSPLGIVPRELESTYPAAQYDIPVTGHWDEDERRRVREMLTDLLSRRRYPRVIAHLDRETEFLADLLKEADAEITGGDNVLSGDSLKKLQDALGSMKEEVRRPAWPERTADDMIGIASYQFGDVWRALLDEVTIRGRHPMLKGFAEGRQILSLVPERGMLALTLEGGMRLASTGRYCVEIDDFVPKGNIFAIGVEDASPEIRIGDEVCALCDGEVRAVGTARMNHIEMCALDRGEAVHVRHHV